MKIAIISVSTILHATSFGAYLVATVCTLMLLIFVFVNVCIISEYIRIESVKLQSFQLKKLRLGGRSSIAQYSAIKFKIPDALINSAKYVMEPTFSRQIIKAF